MAVNITATRSSTLFNDQDSDGQIDPGDIVTTRIRITVGPGDNAEGVTVNATTNGLTVDALDPNAVRVTPIGFDDFLPSITGNTPMTFTAAQLLGNDVDPDGAEIALSITGVSGASNGAIVNNGDGTFTFTPTTGYVGTASFQYTVSDEDGLASVSTGIVTFSVTDPVWYVNNATGSDITGDGSWAKPFASLVPLNTGGSADALDNANDTIFVYNAGTYANASIALEAGQKLFGDGHAFVVNGLSIGANASNTTLGHAGVAVTLSTDNTIMGLTLNGTANGAVAIEDGNGTVGTLTIDNSGITGLGKAIDIDQGGTLNVDLDVLSSASSTSEGIHLQGVTGTFNAATGIIQSSTGTGVLIGAAGGGIANSGNDVNFTFGGDISSPGGSLVEVEDRTGGTVTFTGQLTEGSIAAGTTGILVDGSAGTVNFNGQTFVSAGGLGGNGVTLTNNTGTINFNATGTGLDITTATGSGLTFTGGGTLNVTGTGNSVVTGTGQVLNLQNGAIGNSGIAFQTLTSGNVSSGNAININNLDGSGTFSGGAVTIGGTAGAGADGINITGSTAAFTFASATIDNTAGDGIEINGTTPNTTGAVTFTTVNLDGMAGAGVNIVGATSVVNINGGTIGATNDPTGDGVTILNGTGAVTVAASVTQSSGGNNVVDVSGHSGGTITFSGAITANVGGGGIRLVNNSGGNIDFTGNTTLNTGSLSAITFTNTGATGANVTFSEGTLDLDVGATVSGGINATSTTVGAGSLTISGASNSVNAVGGRAINVDGVTLNATLLDVSASGGNNTAVFLKNTGSGGQFVVTGTGSTAGTGGTIQNIGDGGTNAAVGAAPTTGTGYYFENVSNVSLSNISITGSMGNFGIRGENVNNFTLRDSSIQSSAGSWLGNNESVDEGAIRFGTQGTATGTTGLRGTALFEGNTIGGGYEDNLVVYVYGNNTLNMTVKDSANDQAVFNVNSTSLGNDSLALESGGTSNVTLNVNGVTFNGAGGDQLGISQVQSTTQTLNITGNTFHNTHTNTVSGGGGVWILGGDTAVTSNVTVNYTFSGNSIKNAQGDAFRAIYSGHAATINGLVLNNTIGTNNGVFETNANGGSVNGGSGIDVGFTRSSGSGTLNYAVRIEGNTVRDIQNAFGGIMLASNMIGTTGTARLEATIKNNTVQEVGGNVLAGLYAIVGGASSPANSQDASEMGLVIQGNTFTAGAVNGGSAIFLDQLSGNANYYIPGYTVNANTSHGEFRPSGGGGTASTSLHNFWGSTNTLINGPFTPPAPVIANSKVDANFVTGIENKAFVLAVPAMAALQDGIGWEDLEVSPVTAPPRSPEPAVGSDAPGSTGGDMGSGGIADPGPGGSGSTGGSGTAPTPPASTSLTQASLAATVEAAIQRWIDAGASAAQVDAMRAVQFGIVDMAGIFVGSSTHGIVNIDNDAAGRGWFVDSTPGEDSEYEGSGTRLAADAGGPAEGKIDLLTVVMHELGHQIGLGDEYSGSSSSELMYGYVDAGERRLPAAGEAAGATPGSVGATAYAITPVLVGTIPSGKTVDVLIRATVNDQRDGFVTPLVNSAEISGSNFTTVVVQETLTLDSLTLGNLVFTDVNRDGDYDAGTDTGIVGVVVDLYADTNDDGVWDAGDAFLGTTTTLAGGLYSFAGLAHGDYIVVIRSTNFGSGGALDGLQVTPGIAADPDDNVENDNNGAAATGGAVASKAINLEYNQEPTAGTGNDVNNSVDFGFAENAPPVAVDDTGLTAVEDTPAQYSTELTANDTDPEGDTRTIVSAGNAVNGTVSVTAGVVTFTPTANFNGVATFEYTIDDGNGNTDVGLATVTVSAVNDAPVNTLGGTVAITEDSAAVALTGMSISDVDANPATDVMYFTFQVANGSLAFRYDVAGGITQGDVLAEGAAGEIFTIMTTLNKINATLAASNGLTYTPKANFNGADTLTVYSNDGGATGADPGLSGDATSEEGVASRTITISSVNDAPVVIGDGTVEAATIVEDTPGAGETVNSLFAGQYSDAADAQSSVANPGGSSQGAFTGVAVFDNGSSAATGQWQYYNSGTSTWVDIGARSPSSALLIANTTLVRFNPALDFTGAAPTLTVRLIDNSLGYSITFGQTIDISAAGATGGSTPYSGGTVVLSQAVTAANLTPTVDLDGDDSNTAGTGFASSYSEGGAAAAISDTDVTIADGDSGDDIVSATITITNAEAGDILNVGTLPATVTVDGTSTATMVKLVAAPGTSAADFEAAIEAVTYSNTGDNPTDGGTNTARTITVTVNDGVSNSAAATATVTVTDDNADAPSGTSSTITAVEDTFRLIEAADLGFTDSDGTFASVTISAVSGGGLYFDADGSAGAGTPVLATLPATYTAQDLADGKVSFRADSNANGAGIGTVTFAVTDDDGNVDASPNVLTVNVTAVNDSPELTTAGPIAATEQTTVAILPSGSVADVDLDARNGGLGDYAGAQFSVNRNGAPSTDDVFTLVAGPNFTIDGINLKTTGGQIFATISANNPGLIVVTFNSSEAIATSALVDEVIQAVRYTNTSDNPPASVDLAVGITDGSPGGGQGSGATGLDVNVVTVNIAGVNDAPVNTVGGSIGTIEDAVDAWLSGMSISDPDADPATDKIFVTFQVTNGTLELRTDVAGGIVAGDIIAQAVDTVTVQATLNQINATLSANNGLTYSPTANYNGPAELTVTTNDAGHNGTDPGLTGDGTSEEDEDKRAIDVQAQPDAPIAQPDAVSTAENAIGTGSLFANNGSGPDSDADGDPITVSEVNGSPADVGQPIVLASGAILTVNADGTYSYNPNGKFNRLTDNSSGAVNTSTVGDTFSYTVTGGNTVTVTMTVNGVAGPGDWLMGDGGDNTITGTPQNDIFVVSQGGNDTVSGLGDNDAFYFGGALTAADNVDGGQGTDTVVLQGDYSGGLVLDGSVVNIERISMLAGTNTAFGDPGTNLYDYDLTTDDANFAAGLQVTINGSPLLAGEDFRFDGSAETDAKFVILGGRGQDDLTGGAGNDIFFFAQNGQFAAGDTVDGGGGYDGLFLRGNYTIDFTQAGYAGALSGLENLTVSGATDERYARGGGTEFDYSITWDGDALAAGQSLTVNGSTLGSEESLSFNGSDETDGRFSLFGGRGNDVLTGGSGADLIFGGLRGDTLTGGLGNDIFRYDSTGDSNSTERDGIQDFNAGDVIDLTKIDANELIAGNQAFNFVGSAAFSGAAGELRFENISLGGPIWLVQGDTNGDGVSDFEVVLVINPPDPITSSDFIL